MAVKASSVRKKEEAIMDLGGNGDFCGGIAVSRWAKRP